MALWGEVCVNDLVVAQWSAQRLDDLSDVDQVSLYHCEYIAVKTLSGWQQSDIVLRTEAVVEHRYSDGAAELARKVLQLDEGGW